MFRDYDSETGSWNNDRLVEMMDVYTNEVYGTLEKIVHPKYVKEFAEILAISYFEEESPAVSIAHSLHLSRIHFCALMEDSQAFLHEYIKQKEEEYEPSED